MFQIPAELPIWLIIIIAGAIWAVCAAVLACLALVFVGLWIPLNRYAYENAEMQRVIGQRFEDQVMRFGPFRGFLGFYVQTVLLLMPVKLLRFLTADHSSQQPGKADGNAGAVSAPSGGDSIQEAKTKADSGAVSAPFTDLISRVLFPFPRIVAESTEAIRLDPNNVEAYYDRGLAYLDLEDFDQAIRDFTEVLRLDPNKVEAYYDRGYAYLEMGNFDQAISDFTEVLRLDPNKVGAYCGRGIACVGTDDLDQAITDFAEVLRLDPTNFEGYRGRGVAFQKKGEPAQAFADFVQAEQILTTRRRLSTEILLGERTYAVTYKPAAEQELADIWINAPNRRALLEAVNQLDALLRASPYQGRSRDDTAMIQLQGRSLSVPVTQVMFQRPLALEFEIHRADYRVEVLKVSWIGE